MRDFCALLLVALLAPGASVPSGYAQPAPDTSAFRVYTGSGTPATLEDIVAATDTVSVVFLGEVHDDTVAHHLEVTLLRRAYERYSADSLKGRPVALSLEMFERDAQPVLDEYLAGLITEPHFTDDSRPWPNYAKAYRPLVEFAKAHDLAVVAANAPRRYVNRVAREGAASLRALPHNAHAWLPPLPFDAEPSDAYRAKWRTQMQAAAQAHPGAPATDEAPNGDTSQTAGPFSPEASPAPGVSPPPTAPPSGTPHGQGSSGAHGGMNMSYLLEAQMLWDATMGHAITQHLVRTPEALVLHVTGGFHVSGGVGTPDQVRRYRPGTPMLTVVMQPVDDIAAFDPEQHAGRGDFVILTGGPGAKESQAEQSF